MIKRKFAAISVVALIITTTSTPANGVEIEKLISSPASSISIREVSLEEKIMFEARIAREQAILNNNLLEIKGAIKKLNKYVNKTWYVFSGNTPAGWDCSGLTMWFYEQLGIELYHRASVQKYAGKIHSEPKLGDIVAFSYAGYKNAFHVGIYVGNGKMIHSPSKGKKTTIVDIQDWADGNGNVTITYTRFIETS